MIDDRRTREAKRRMPSMPCMSEGFSSHVLLIEFLFVGRLLLLRANTVLHLSVELNRWS